MLRVCFLFECSRIRERRRAQASKPRPPPGTAVPPSPPSSPSDPSAGDPPASAAEDSERKIFEKYGVLKDEAEEARGRRQAVQRSEDKYLANIFRESREGGGGFKLDNYVPFPVQVAAEGTFFAGEREMELALRCRTSDAPAARVVCRHFGWHRGVDIGWCECGCGGLCRGHRHGAAGQRQRLHRRIHRAASHSVANREGESSQAHTNERLYGSLIHMGVCCGVMCVSASGDAGVFCVSWCP